MFFITLQGSFLENSLIVLLIVHFFLAFFHCRCAVSDGKHHSIVCCLSQEVISQASRVFYHQPLHQWPGHDHFPFSLRYSLCFRSQVKLFQSSNISYKHKSLPLVFYIYITFFSPLDVSVSSWDLIKRVILFSLSSS